MNTSFINKKWILGAGDAFVSLNPTTGQKLLELKAVNAEQVDSAVAAARAAQDSWSALTYTARYEYIISFINILQEQKDSLIKTIAEETGKTLWESATEVQAMFAKADISLQAYKDRTFDQRTKLDQGDLVVRHKPIGVLAVFAPFNFPAHLPNGHIIPALIAGNTIVLKPSEFTPLVAIKLVELWEQANLPAGVINLLQGADSVGKHLAAHQDINGLLFTGSSKVGKILHNQFGGSPEKMLALEMGGNNPLIVDGVSNINAAVYDIINSAYITSGQRCTCARRLYLKNDANGDQILSKLVEATKKIEVGHYDRQPQPFIGSLISKEAAVDLVRAQDLLLSAGGEVLVKLQHLDVNSGLVSPGIIDMSNATKTFDQEWFGPLLQVYRFDSLSAAIDKANATQYGLSSALLSDSRDSYEQYLAKIKSGLANWNRQTTGSLSQAPFGGIGVSGNFRPSAYYAADYCAYPVASIERDCVALPDNLVCGLTL